ncbi:MAG: ECF-type sigma factor [Gemmatimonas sp.]
MSSRPPTPEDDGPGDVTTWLRRLREQRAANTPAGGPFADGQDANAQDALAPLVYAELHRLAVNLMRGEQSAITLQPTALVHEAWMRLVQQHSTQFNDRAHFFAIAVRLMRRVLVDQARRRSASKRDGGQQESIDNIDIEAPVIQNADEVLRVHEALQKFALVHERQAQVVELRFFAGLTVEEIAALVGVSEPTVKRDWVVARAWLQRELSASA